MALVRERGMAVLSDERAIESIARAVIEQSPRQVAGYRAGKTALLGYFIGQVMKQTKGQANPEVVTRLITERIQLPA